MCEIYYTSSIMSDMHNICRQGDLDIERKIDTKECVKIFNMSLFGMCVVDA